MKLSRSVMAPATVLGVAILSGGWFLQQGVDQDQNVYFQVRLLEEVVDHISSQYVEDVERGLLYQSAIEGLIDRLGDPNTSFISASQYEDFRIRTQGDYGGVGLEIVERDGFITVVSPIPGSPGDRAGIRPGDQFVEIAGQDAEGWDVEQAVDVLRGKPGAEVDVKVRRPGVDQPIPFTLARAEIHLKAVPFAVELEDGIAYVPLRIFRETSSAEVQSAVRTLSRSGRLRGLVLDLRGNPGGLLEEGIGVSDLFLPPGATVVETRGRAAGQDEEFKARTSETFPGLPVVVLVDGASASASEIVAGALQDHDRALVVGMPSFGKGSVQTLFRLSGGNVLRLTTARWYTPVGRSIQKEEDAAGEAPLPRTLTFDGRLMEAPDTSARPKVQSMGGRTLYGGGGITPDLVVLPDTLTTVEQTALQALFQQAAALELALFNHAVRYNQEHPRLSRSFELGPDELRRFSATLSEFGVDADPTLLAQSERYFRFRLTREIALQAWGEEAEFQIARAYDVQLQLAVEALRDAVTPEDLFRVAAKLSSPSRDVPAKTSSALSSALGSPGN